MTVLELITELSAYPMDSDVKINSAPWEYSAERVFEIVVDSGVVTIEAVY